MIGAGVRVAGDITFTGVLRVQGNILGDVSCDADRSGTVVVDESGNVTGTVTAPHIVVGGRVSGPANSSGSIEVRTGASLIGDASYKAIEVQAGGVIEGALTPREPMETSRRRQEETPSLPDVPGRGGSWITAVGAVGAAVAAAVAAMWVIRDPLPASPASFTPKTETAAGEPGAARPAAAAADARAQVSAPDPVADQGATAQTPDAGTGQVAQMTSADLRAANPENVVALQGVNPAKPANVFSVISNERTVMLRKKRQDPGDGMRLEFPKGAVASVTIGTNEIFRVAEGQKITIFFQGRKVTAKTIESGAWISFVPHAPGAETVRE